ncbi:MAG: hypothetical protein Q7U20_10320 [Caulobacter sp.]|nr:hypothetical protein [Caulobacter sp.]
MAVWPVFLSALLLAQAAAPETAQDGVRFGPFTPDSGVAETMAAHPEYQWTPVYPRRRPGDLVGAKAAKPLSFAGHDWDIEIGAALGFVMTGQRYDLNLWTNFDVGGERECRRAFSDLVGTLEVLYNRAFGNHPAFKRNGNSLYLDQDFRIIEVGKRSIARDQGDGDYITFLELDEERGDAVSANGGYSEYDGTSCILRIHAFGDDGRPQRALESRRPYER